MIEKVNLDTKIDDLPFKIRVMTALYGLDLMTVGKLIQNTAQELLETRNFGLSSLREVRKVLASCGFALKGDILFDSEAEKKLIQDMPKTIKEIEMSLRDLDRKIRNIALTLDQLHCNMQPLEK